MNELIITRIYSYSRGNAFFIYFENDREDILEEIENIAKYYDYDMMDINIDDFLSKEYITSLLNKDIDYEEMFFFIVNDIKDEQYKKIYEYINNKKGQIFELDYDDEPFTIIDEKLSKPLFYLSYNIKDINIAKMIKEFLIKHDYEVYDEADHPSHDTKKKLYYNAYSKSHGYYCPIISRNSINDKKFYKDFLYRKKTSSEILPLLLNNIKLEDYPRFEEGVFLYFPLQSVSINELEELIEYINMEEDF